MATYIRRYSIRYVKPGMKLANPVVSPAGAIVASENTVLTERIIDRLIVIGLNYVDILETREDPEGRQLAEIQQNFLKAHDEITGSVKTIFSQARYFKTVPLEQMQELADKSVQALVGTPGVINHLQMIQDVDNYTYNHSVNVAVICGIIGRWIGYENISDIVLAGLMHDFGKTQIPLQVLNKPGALSATELQVMRKHAVLGWEMCKGDSRIPACVLAGIIEHHERLDGSGYPFGIKDDEISQFGRIVAIADIFDAMTSNRVYRRAQTPFSVLRELFSEMFGRLDPAACALFIENLQETLVGYTVLLSDGTIARVVYIDRSRQAEPVVETMDGRFINLADTDLKISEVVSS